MKVGTAEAAPGELARGWLTVTDLPTGGVERLPVVVANGTEDGPTLWVTGGVHGDEATGIAVAQDVLREDLPALLSGAMVCVPVVSPAGLRRNTRHTYYGDDDPNRHFPDVERDSSRPPEVQERIDRRVTETIAETADAHLDLHTAGVGSVPFVIHDRVLYGEERTRAEAEALAADLTEFVDAYGLPVLNEYPPEEYVEQNLQRSNSGATLNVVGIPSCTVELGSHSVVEEDNRAAGVAGVFGVADHMGLLNEWPDGVADPGEGVPDAPVDFPVRRFVGPRTETAGVVRHRVAAGDAVEAGDVVADIVTVAGEHLDTVESEHDGYVIGRREGVAVYEGDPVASMAVRDDGDAVAPRDGVEE